jgi:hypothetical protein
MKIGELFKQKCERCGQNEASGNGHDCALVLGSHCHPGAGVSPKFFKATGVLQLHCAQCSKFVVDLEINKPIGGLIFIAQQIEALGVHEPAPVDSLFYVAHEACACENTNCGLMFNSPCHKKDGVYIKFEKQNGVMRMECAKCEAPLSELAVPRS